MNKRLINLGLSESKYEEYMEKYKGMIIGRVYQEHKNIYRVITENNTLSARLSGSYSFKARDRMDYPAVGDWVILEGNESFESHIIKELLPRKSVFTRKVAGRKLDEQIIASNIDYLFICMALNNDFNLRRLERFIASAYNSGSLPVIVLTKSDLCEDLDDKLEKIGPISIGIEVIVTSSYTMEGIEDIKKYIRSGVTVAFTGSSGVGKSSLTNTIIGRQVQDVGIIRSDDKGKHVTSSRNLIVLDDGGVVIDTPGMREIQILDINESVDESFSDIEDLMAKCKFSNCSHKNEKDCMIIKAIEDGSLDIARYESYEKLKREAQLMAKKLRKKEKSLEKRNSKSRKTNEGSSPKSEL